MKTRRGLGPRHTAPVHRQTGVLSGDQTATPPIQVGRNGSYELSVDDSLIVDERGRLSVEKQFRVSADSLAGDNLAVEKGKLRVALDIVEAKVTVSSPPTQAEVQAIADKLDELIRSMQSQTVRTIP